MFCPKCGKGEQNVDSYCRGCGELLPDFEKIRTRGLFSKTPEENIKSSLILSTLSSVISIAMAILLYVIPLGREDALTIISVAAVFFTVIGVWQMFNIFTNIRLKKQFAKRKGNSENGEEQNAAFQNQKTRELLNEPDFENIVPLIVTEQTTNKLVERIVRKSSQSKH